ncbi:MAG: type II toxin-antitoxin system RelB/DinJ family antitoxin [Schwartzia sp. (in: firmicutes)]
MNQQVLVQFRADKAVKAEAAKLFETLGLDLPTALRMFLARSLSVQGIPFDVRVPQPPISREDAWAAFQEMREQAAKVPEMSLDEINDEISAMRTERRAKI